MFVWLICLYDTVTVTVTVTVMVGYVQIQHSVTGSRTLEDTYIFKINIRTAFTVSSTLRQFITNFDPRSTKFIFDTLLQATCELLRGLHPALEWFFSNLHWRHLSARLHLAHQQPRVPFFFYLMKYIAHSIRVRRHGHSAQACMILEAWPDTIIFIS